MKTFLAALAAGLIGGGAAIGAVALNLVPMQATPSSVTAKTPTLEADAPSDTSGGVDYQKQVTDLKHQVEALEVQLANNKSNDTIAALRKEVDELKKARTVAAPKPATGEDAVEVSPAPAVTPEFDAAVREVMTRAAEERAEERRLNQQAERLSELEAQKTQIAEYVPKVVASQASNLGIAETLIPDVSNALVTHAQFRAEIASEMRGLRIDDIEVDAEAYKLKFEELNQTTIAALSSYVDQATAEKLVSSLERAGRNNGRNNNQPRRARGN